MNPSKPLTLNPKHRRLLKEARHRLLNHQSTLICIALKSYALQHRGMELQYYKEYSELRDRIQVLIAPFGVLTDWVKNQPSVMKHEVTPDAMRAHRIAWIDKMLTEGVL